MDTTRTLDGQKFMPESGTYQLPSPATPFSVQMSVFHHFGFVPQIQFFISC